VGESMDYIQIGKIINTHGIKGEVKVYPLTYDINRFSNLKKAYLGQNKIKVEVEKVKYHKDLVIIKFKEFNNINEILLYKDKFIYIEKEDIISLPKNHFFIFDIVDCQVFNMAGDKIGVVTEVIQSASNDVYVIRNYEKNKEYMIPAIKEFFVNIDIDNKKIVINPIEGMIE
jgi:16S rRNA processing protein RimM